jgi:hypothetical protein
MEVVTASYCSWSFIYLCNQCLLQLRNCHGRDNVVVRFTTTYAVSANHHSREFETPHGEVYSIQHYVIKFISDLRQASGFLRVLRFRLPIKLNATI